MINCAAKFSHADGGRIAYTMCITNQSSFFDKWRKVVVMIGAFRMFWHSKVRICFLSRCMRSVGDGVLQEEGEVAMWYKPQWVHLPVWYSCSVQNVLGWILSCFNHLSRCCNFPVSVHVPCTWATSLQWLKTHCVNDLLLSVCYSNEETFCLDVLSLMQQIQQSSCIDVICGCLWGHLYCNTSGFHEHILDKCYFNLTAKVWVRAACWWCSLILTEVQYSLVCSCHIII